MAVLLPSAGSSWLFLALLHTRAHVASRIDKGMHDEKLILLDIPKEVENEAYKFVRIHAREFIYHGQMYDVISALDMGGTTRYLVFPDHAETKLKRKMAAQSNQTNNLPLGKTIERIASLNWIVQSFRILLVEPPMCSLNFSNAELPVKKGFTQPHFRPPNIRPS